MPTAYDLVAGLVTLSDLCAAAVMRGPSPGTRPSWLQHSRTALLRVDGSGSAASQPGRV
jgi:hypothetical protein